MIDRLRPVVFGSRSTLRAPGPSFAPRPPRDLDQAAPVEHGVDRALGRNADVHEFHRLCARAQESHTYFGDRGPTGGSNAFPSATGSVLGMHSLAVFQRPGGTPPINWLKILSCLADLRRGRGPDRRRLGPRPCSNSARIINRIGQNPLGSRFGTDQQRIRGSACRRARRRRRPAPGQRAPGNG